MKLESVADQVSLTTSTPVEAAENLNNSRSLGVGVGVYKESKAEFAPDLKRFSSPLATPIVARNIARSEEHAALVAPDAEPLGLIEGAWKSFKESLSGGFESTAQSDREFGNEASRVITATPRETFNAVMKKTGPEARMNELGFKKLRAKGVGADQFTEDDEFELTSLRQDEQSNFGLKPSGLTGMWETAFPQTVAQIADLPALIERNKGTIASITAGTVALNAGVGALIGGPPGALVGAKIGVGEGLFLGWRLASGIDAYRATAGSTYNYLDTAVDANKNPLNIDDGTKVAISHGVGIASGVVATIADKMLIKRVPWLNRMMNGEGVKEIMTKPGHSQLKSALLNIGRAMAGEGAEESTQEYFQIIGEEIGQTWNQSEASFVNGLLNASEKILKNKEGKGARVLQAGTIGAFAGAGTTVALNTTGKVVGATVDKVSSMREGQVDLNLPTTPMPVAPATTDISPESVNPHTQAINVLQFQDVVDGTALVAGTTKLSQLSPIEQTEIITQIISDSGVEKVYIDRDDLQEFADDEENGEKVRQILGETPDINAPIAIPMHQFMELRTQFPTISEYMKLQANGPSPKTAKQFATELDAAAKKREEITNKMGAYEKPATERAYAIQINEDLDDDVKLGQAVQTKDVANEFLTRLDVEDMSEADVTKTLAQAYGLNASRMKFVADQIQTAEAEGDLESLAELKDTMDELNATRERLTNARMDLKKASGRRKSVRERLSVMRDTMPDDKSAKAILQQALDTPQPINDVFGEADYMNQPTITDALREVMPEKEAQAIDEAVNEARKEVADKLNAGARKELEGTRDVYAEIAETAILQEEEARIANDPNIALVDRFTDVTFTQADISIEDVKASRARDIAAVNAKITRAENKIKALQGDVAYADALAELKDEKPNQYTKAQQIKALKREIKSLNYEIKKIKDAPVARRFLGTETHRKPGYSPFAIDPETLSEKQREAYLKSPQMKKHKAFVKGGMSPQDAAIVLGVRDGDMLLDILNRTPSREDQIQARIELRANEVDQMAEDAVGIDEDALSEAFNKKADSYVQIAKYLKDKDWSTFKKAIKRIALRTPIVQQLRNNARKAVRAMRIGDLNVNQFRTGERKSHRKAMNNITSGDVESAFVNLEATILNSELQLATMNAHRQLNRGIRFVKKFMRAEAQQEIKDAGPQFVKAMNEILDNFNLVPNKKGESIRGSWRAFVKSMVAIGRGDIAISEELTDVRENFSDMTVDQALAAFDRLRAIQKLARDENVSRLAAERQTLEQLAAEAQARLRAQHQYDPKKAVRKQGAKTFGQEYIEGFLDSTELIKGLPHITTQLDDEKTGGWFYDLIVAPLKGQGKFKGKGEDGKATAMIKLRKRFDEIIKNFNDAGKKEFGLNEWNQMQNTVIDVPEFAGNPHLKGKVTKGQLWMMQLNLGNEGNAEALTNGYGIDITTLQAVLDRELDEKYAVLTQAVWDTYGSYWAEVEAHEERMTGIKPEKVEATAYIHRGRVMPGGYFPIMHDSEMSAERLAKRDRDRAKAIKADEVIDMSDTFYSSDMTRHNHTEKRVGSTKPLSLDLNKIGMSFEAIIHDLNYREPISEILKVLTHPGVSQDIASIVGPTGYNTILNAVIVTSGSVQQENNAIYNADKVISTVVGNLLGRSSVSALVFSPASMFMQFASFPVAINRMGYRNAVKHMSRIALGLNNNPNKIVGFTKLADDILPSLKNSRQNYDDNMRDSISEVLPEETGMKQTAAFWYIKNKAVRAGYGAFGAIDNAMKSLVAVASYSQFMSGDVEGWSIDQVMALSPEERDHQAKIYAGAVTEQTLTAGSQIDRAQIQRQYRAFAQYFNDSRNVIGNMLHTKRKVSRDIKRGDYDKAAMSFVGTWVMLASVNLFTNAVKRWRGYGGEEDDDTLEGWMKNRAQEVLFAPIDVATDVLPIVREFKFALQTDIMTGKQGAVPGNPLVSAGVNVKNVLQYGYNFMLDTDTEIDRKTAKSMLLVASYATPGGLPVKPMNLIYEAITEPEELLAAPIGMIDLFREKFKSFEKTQADLPKKEQVPTDVMEELRNIDIEVTPPEEKKRDTASFIPEGTYDVIAMIESGHNPLAQNPNSSAAGLYQFTKATWDDAKERSGLTLTDNGRVSKNTEQQEAAMKWFTEQNVEKLQAANIEVTIPHIYAAHFLGARRAIKVLAAPGDMKLKNLITEDAMEANDFPNNMKVRDFKKWVQNKVNTAIDSQEADDREAMLTLVDNET